MSGTSTEPRQKTQNTQHLRQTQMLEDPKISDVAVDAAESLRIYAKKRPEVVAMWCLGVGFVLGWKLKPW